MTLRQLTKPVAPLKLDVQKPDENINPLVPDQQDPSSGSEDYPIPNYQFKILMIPDRDAKPIAPNQYDRSGMPYILVPLIL